MPSVWLSHDAAYQSNINKEPHFTLFASAVQLSIARYKTIVRYKNAPTNVEALKLRCDYWESLEYETAEVFIVNKLTQFTLNVVSVYHHFAASFIGRFK